MMRWIYVPFWIMFKIYILSKVHISPLRFPQQKRPAELKSPHSQLSNGEKIVENGYNHGELRPILWYDEMVRWVNFAVIWGTIHRTYRTHRTPIKKPCKISMFVPDPPLRGGERLVAAFLDYHEQKQRKHSWISTSSSADMLIHKCQTHHRSHTHLCYMPNASSSWIIMKKPWKTNGISTYSWAQMLTYKG